MGRNLRRDEGDQRQGRDEGEEGASWAMITSHTNQNSAFQILMQPLAWQNRHVKYTCALARDLLGAP